MSILSKLTKAVCIGRNYADHAVELGNAIPKAPMFFIKPASSVLRRDSSGHMPPILRPRGVQVHYELELAVVLNKQLKDADPKTFTAEQAQKYIGGYCLGLDLTARNIQTEAKTKGLPWTEAKGFDTFLPLSELVPPQLVPDPHNAWLKLVINGETKQDDSTSKMIHKIPALLAHVSNIMTLEAGDVLLTGTPKGVGEIVPGDEIHGELIVDGKTVSNLDVTIEERQNFYEFKSK